MTIIAADFNSMRRKTYTVDDLNDETELIPVGKDGSLMIHVSGASGSTWCVNVYVTGNTTPVKAEYSGETDFDRDLVLNCQLAGDGFVSVKMLTDGGSMQVTFTKG